MQITRPIDVEDALRLDLAPYLPHVTVCAQPAPDELAAPTVCVEAIGGGATSPVSWEHDVVAYCWGATPQEAVGLACEVAGLLGSMRMREAPSGAVYATCDADAPYLDPDPERPTIPRATVQATVALRGLPVQID